MGAPSITNAGKGSRTRVRDRKVFRANFDEIDMSKRIKPMPSPTRVKAGKTTYSYG